MSPCSRIFSATILAALLAVSACGSEESSKPRPRPDDKPVAQAEVTPLPDFHRYVIGPLPPPRESNRDPFHETDFVEPRTEPRAAPSGNRVRAARFFLHGIVERDDQRVAVFDRGSVRVGEIVAGWTVIEIGPRDVLLRRNGKTRRVSL